MTDVLVRDETMAGRELGSWLLSGVPERVTARELVRLRVREEAGWLSAAFPGELIDGAAEADAAFLAFEEKRFVLVIGERQVADLDEVIELRPEGAVAYMRLTPVAGG